MSPMAPVNLRATAGAPHRFLGLLTPASAHSATSCGHSWKIWEIVSWPSSHYLQAGSTSGRRRFSYEVMYGGGVLVWDYVWWWCGGVRLCMVVVWGYVWWGECWCEVMYGGGVRLCMVVVCWCEVMYGGGVLVRGYVWWWCKVMYGSGVLVWGYVW